MKRIILGIVMIDEIPRTPRWIVALPILVTVAAVAIGLGLALALRSQLPDPIATHWGLDGRPDGYSSLPAHLIFASLFPLIMTGFLMLMGIGVRQQRAMAAFGSGLGVFLSWVCFGSALAQRGADPRTSQVDLTIIVGTLVGAAAGIVAWLIIRPRRVATPRSEPAARPRIAWSGRTRAGLGAWISLGLSTLVLLVLGAAFVIAGSTGVGFVMFLLATVVAVLGSSCWAQVTIDWRGVRVRSLGLFTWARIDLATIETAGTGTVDPLGEFGGYGIRGGFDGSAGVVTAKGEALRLQRTGAGPYWITVDDAEAAAAAVTELLGQARR